MKKVFLVILVFFAVSAFAQKASDYKNILNGDLSAFAGYWVSGNNNRVYLKADGKAYRDVSAGGFKKTEDFYTWGNGSEWGGVTVMLFPVGVVIYKMDSGGNYDTTGKSGIVESDKTKVRLFLGQEFPYDPKDIFYKEAKFPATHSASENLKIRADQNSNSEAIAVIDKNTKVLVYKWGNYESIGGMNARWAYVYTADGLMGWCYSGFLKELKK